MSLAALETSYLLPSGVAPPPTCRLPWYSTFGRDKFPISQEDSIVHETTIDRLHWYSTCGWDKLPISQEDSTVHETTIDRLLRYSTFGWDKLPISQEDLHVHKIITIDYYGTRSEKRQHLKKSYSSTRRKLRKRHDLYIHTRRSIKKSSYKKNPPTH